jgi:hypothetical protein
MKRHFSSAIIACSVILMAYGYSHSNSSNSASKEPRSVRNASLDPVADCTIEHEHQHDGEYYAGHYNNDGHGHHGLKADNICPFANCEKTSLHRHNGMNFAGHHGSGGYWHRGNRGHGWRH